VPYSTFYAIYRPNADYCVKYDLLPKSGTAYPRDMFSDIILYL